MYTFQVGQKVSVFFSSHEVTGTVTHVDHRLCSVLMDNGTMVDGVPVAQMQSIA